MRVLKPVIPNVQPCVTSLAADRWFVHFHRNRQTRKHKKRRLFRRALADGQHQQQEQERQRTATTTTSTPTTNQQHQQQTTSRSNHYPISQITRTRTRTTTTTTTLWIIYQLYAVPQNQRSLTHHVSTDQSAHQPGPADECCRRSYEQGREAL